MTTTTTSRSRIARVAHRTDGWYIGDDASDGERDQGPFRTRAAALNAIRRHNAGVPAEHEYTHVRAPGGRTVAL